jgi:general stress protein CsbA
MVRNNLHLLKKIYRNKQIVILKSWGCSCQERVQRRNWSKLIWRLVVLVLINYITYNHWYAPALPKSCLTIVLKIVSSQKAYVGLKNTTRWYLAWDRGVGHCFDFLIRRCLVFDIIMFPVSTAIFFDDFCIIRWSAVSTVGVHALPILSCP